MGADVFAIGGGVGATPGCHFACLFVNGAFGKGFEVEFDEVPTVPEVDGVVDGADNAAGATFGIEVGELGDFAICEVVAKEVARVFALGSEDEGLVVVEPAGVGEVEVVGEAQIVGEALNFAVGIAVCIRKFGILVDASLAHVTSSRSV